jgi:hypothetical protein
MNTGKYIFQGNVRIYLQGENALCPMITNAQEAHYRIGQENTEFIIHDYRREPVLAAQKAISTQYQNGFSNTFNQQSWAEVRYEPTGQKIEIDLREPVEATTEKTPLLWFGVLDDNRMPAYEVDWEVFKPLTGGTAFVSLVR